MALEMWKKSGCCCEKNEPIEQIGIGDDSIGLVGLSRIFEQLRALGRPPDESVEDELLLMVGARNYIPPRAENEYRFALRREYAKYCAKKESRGHQ